MAQRIDARSAQALAVGTVINSVTLPPTTMTQMVYYCAAARVTDPIHFDRDYARAHGFPDAIVNGSLRVAWLAQILCDVVESPNRVADLKCAHQGLVLVGQTVRIEARTTGAAQACEGGWLLPCTVETSVESNILDRADGQLFLAQS
jgi:acyl dehydratase